MSIVKKLQKCVTFSDVLRFHAQNSSDHLWLHEGITGRDYSFKEIDDLVDRAASYLKQNGCNPGDIISVILNNCLEYIILFFAAIRLGLIFNPFPISLSSRDIQKYLNYIQPKLVFCNDNHFKELNNNRWTTKLITKRDGQKTEEGFGADNLVKQLKACVRYDKIDYRPKGSEAACIYYSSGTTADPKGVICSHENMISNISSIVRGFGWDREDAHLIILPLGHTAAINYSLLPCMYCGGRIVLFESFWKIRDRIWKHIQKFNITYIEVVPSVLFSILNTPYKDYDRNALRSFKYIGCGSAPLPIETQKRIEARFKLKVANLYGLSETGPTHIDNPLVPGWKPGSIGCPLDVNDVRIYNVDGSESGVGQVGEIAVKGDNVFVGYFKNERAYSQAFKNKYFFTGDLGYRDDEGIFYFSERKKDLIIKGGVNIFPGEIDEVIYEHGQIKEALTVGVQDEYLGQRIMSFVVLKEKNATSQDHLRQFCLDRLGRFKCPDEFVFVDNIPKGPSGKLLRRALKENV